MMEIAWQRPDEVSAREVTRTLRSILQENNDEHGKVDCKCLLGIAILNLCLTMLGLKYESTSDYWKILLVATVDSIPSEYLSRDVSQTEENKRPHNSDDEKGKEDLLLLLDKAQVYLDDVWKACEGCRDLWAQRMNIRASLLLGIAFSLA